MSQFFGVVVGSERTLVAPPEHTSLVLRNVALSGSSKSAALEVDGHVACTVRPQATLCVRIDGGRVALRAIGPSTATLHVTGTISPQPPSLSRDLQNWRALVRERRALAEASAGLTWEEQAAAERLPVDLDGLALHRACGRLIAKRGLRRGETPGGWRPPRHALCPLPRSWRSLAAAAAMPGGNARRALITDALSFPLTALHALRLQYGAEIQAHDGYLSITILGAEVGAELAGCQKWLVLLRALPAARAVRLLFVGPRVPARLAGQRRRLHLGRRKLELRFLRGVYHDVCHHALALEEPPPALAIAYNSGVADFASSWAPTVRALLAARVPLAFTSYHAPEAGLDARTLATLGARVVVRAAPNPFSSMLPHLDECFVGRTYSANAFLTLCAGEPPRRAAAWYRRA